jgi:hypothetical protein
MSQSIFAYGNYRIRLFVTNLVWLRAYRISNASIEAIVTMNESDSRPREFAQTTSDNCADFRRREVNGGDYSRPDGNGSARGVGGVMVGVVSCLLNWNIRHKENATNSIVGKRKYTRTVDNPLRSAWYMVRQVSHTC